jgi:hypothetical protein
MSNVPSKHSTSYLPKLKSTVLVGLMTALCSITTAQTNSGKTVVVEPTRITPSTTTQTSGTNVFVVFEQWLEGLRSPVVVTDLSVVPAPVMFESISDLNVATFEVMPVILGQPELPLLGQAATEAIGKWNSGFNYQGLQMNYLVVDKSGTRQEVRPISKGLAAGERYKIRYTASFEAVASIDRVVGEIWKSQRVGQAWPQTGMSVASQPGEIVELPVGGGYFVMTGSPVERYVLSVRHPAAKGQARSDQPIYRQDGALGSSYLQLVPSGKFPVLEQLITVRNNN